MVKSKRLGLTLLFQSCKNDIKVLLKVSLTKDFIKISR